ncbi:MAG: hypothetical protein V4676_02270, partial [Bacteroidota bacterium]
MAKTFPLIFQLEDGTQVLVNDNENNSFEFHLTRLNSEKHNFLWNAVTNEIEESYETRFDNWQLEAIEKF